MDLIVLLSILLELCLPALSPRAASYQYAGYFSAASTEASTLTSGMLMVHGV